MCLAAIFRRDDFFFFWRTVFVRLTVTVFPSAANFLLIRFLAVPAAEVFRRLLDDYGILVRDVSAVPELSECLRISVGTAEDMDAVLEALGEILKA